MISLPGWIDKEIWTEFELMRKAIKRPLTDGARRLAIKRLVRLYQEGNDPTEVLEQSILNAWQGLWPINRGRQEWRDDAVSRELRIGQAPSAHGHIKVKEKYQ